jgi:glycosyltransferase involved in cell wall biosynthesis
MTNYSDKISVIIATLGGDQLYDTINSINSNSIIPFEILICIPFNESQKISKQLPKNVKICISDVMGQVPQRTMGFNLAKGDYIIQLDDDLILENNTIEILLNSLLELPINSAIAPSIFVLDTKKSFYKKPQSKLFRNIYYFLINGCEGYKPGILTKALTNIGVDPDESNEIIIKSEWLPGGCIIHNRINTIKYNYFPFKGKAYCEDIYHSLYLNKNGVNLYFHNNAKIWLSETSMNYTYQDKLTNLIKDYKARIYLAKLFPKKRSILSIYIYYFINFKRFIFK